MKKLCFTLLIAGLAATPLFAGVVFEIESKDQGTQKVTTSRASVEGRHFKMEIDTSGGSGKSEMIYRGDRREMVMVDHEDKSYFVLDMETVKELAGDLGEAMNQIEEALANVPEGQRAALEKMMKERMPQLSKAASPKSELAKTGERANQAGYACVKYEVSQDDRKVREMWVTDWDNVDGGEEVAGMFREMSGFLQEMLGAFQSASGAMGGFVTRIADNMFEHMAEIDGFPVVTREFEDGRLDSEATLTSTARRDLDPAAFEPPPGYEKRQMVGR